MGSPLVKMIDEPVDDGFSYELDADDLERARELIKPLIAQFEAEQLDDLTAAVSLLEVALQAFTIMGGTTFTMKMLGSSMIDVAERGEDFEKMLEEKKTKLH